MSYHTRIREIQSAFVMGFQDRETCISLFEGLMHEYGLLPQEEQLDRTITNENFLALLKMAKDHRGIHEEPPDHSDPNLKKLDDLRRAEENLKKLTRWMEQAAKRGADQQYRIADSVKQHCPVCQKPINALFNRVQSLDQQMIPVDPPRCQDCMTKWVNERFGGMPASAPIHTQSADGSPSSPLSPSEFEFFAEYEKQMQEKP
jgi:hypothetical protein